MIKEVRVVQLDKPSHIEYTGDIMPKKREKLDLEFSEAEPDGLCQDEREQRTEAALFAFTRIVRNGLNRRCDETSGAMSEEAARAAVLAWARGGKINQPKEG